eukprot:11245305-Alexandrium_andersonii.AAC.1
MPGRVAKNTVATHARKLEQAALQNGGRGDLTNTLPMHDAPEPIPTLAPTAEQQQALKADIATDSTRSASSCDRHDD